MIQTIFPTYFYSLITPPNKEELIESLTNAPVDEKHSKTLEWPNSCQIKVESLYPNLVGSVLSKTIDIFLDQLEVEKNDFAHIKLSTVWKSTYNKGYYQEIHHHYSTQEKCEISGVVFLTDPHRGASRFYFFNKHYAEMTIPLLRIMEKKNVDCEKRFIIPKAGDVLLFPSYMMHGVTMHQINQRRTTVAFNISLQ